MVKSKLYLDLQFAKVNNDENLATILIKNKQNNTWYWYDFIGFESFFYVSMLSESKLLRSIPMIHDISFRLIHVSDTLFVILSCMVMYPDVSAKSISLP